MPRHYTDADLAAKLRAQGLPVTFKYRANRKPREGPSESQLQQEVIKWWASAHTDYAIHEHLLMAIPLQAIRSPRNGARMKREGARAGTPDLFLAVPRARFSGLWIEMKKPGGVVSDVQTNMIADLNGQNYVTAVCWSSEDAIKEIQIYLQCRL